MSSLDATKQVLVSLTGRAGARHCARAAYWGWCGCLREPWQAVVWRASQLQGCNMAVVERSVWRGAQVQVGPKWAGGSCLGAAM